jgi:hypothetical protein
MNNSATTRLISKIAFEYNGNDKGLAKAVATNFLLSSEPEQQYQEMKTVADRNLRVKKWALTGYISPPNENTRSLSDEELTEIAIEALQKVGVSETNQYRLDIHNSTKMKHIHFIVNRINIDGKCTIKAHDIGQRFGDAVRQICKERSILTDIEIGIEKRAAMLKNLTEVIQQTNNFEDLISEMKLRGFIVQLSKNEKVGISGMRIILGKDINHLTERQYKPGYKLSDISKTLKIVEIKNIFEIKNALLNESNTTSSLKELRENLYRKGWFVKIHYKGEFKQNQKNEVQDFIIMGVGKNKSVQQKDGFFFRKEEGFSLCEIDSTFKDLTNEISPSAEIMSNRDSSSFMPKSILSETLKVATEEFIEDFLKPNYVAQEDEWWKKKRKMRR